MDAVYSYKREEEERERAPYFAIHELELVSNLLSLSVCSGHQ